MPSPANRTRAKIGLPRVIFTDEHDEFRASVRGFLQREGAPKAAEWEAAGIPRSLNLNTTKRPFDILCVNERTEKHDAQRPSCPHLLAGEQPR